MWGRSGSNGGVNMSVMGERGCDNRRRAMTCGLSQSGLSAGLSLKVIGSIKRDPNFAAVGMPIDVVVTPVEGRSIHGTISVKQLLFDKIVAIKLCIAKLVTGRDWKNRNQREC